MRIKHAFMTSLMKLFHIAFKINPITEAEPLLCCLLTDGKFSFFSVQALACSLLCLYQYILGGPFFWSDGQDTLL
jgi:hypothetical protein